MKPAHRARFSLICSSVAVCLLAPSLAHAQLDIHVIPNEAPIAKWSQGDVGLIRFLTEGTAVRAETRQSIDVVLFVARASKGKVVAQGQTRPFRLDAKAASTSSGMVLGSAVKAEQLLGLTPLAGLGETVAQKHETAKESMSDAELTAKPGSAFWLCGMCPGIFAEQGQVLFIAVVPADPAMRERSQSAPLFVGDLGGAE